VVLVIRLAARKPKLQHGNHSCSDNYSCNTTTILVASEKGIACAYEDLREKSKRSSIVQKQPEFSPIYHRFNPL